MKCRVQGNLLGRSLEISKKEGAQKLKFYIEFMTLNLNGDIIRDSNERSQCSLEQHNIYT